MTFFALNLLIFASLHLSVCLTSTLCSLDVFYCFLSLVLVLAFSNLANAFLALPFGFAAILQLLIVSFVLIGKKEFAFLKTNILLKFVQLQALSRSLVRTAAVLQLNLTTSNRDMCQ